jgi:hypothetical protein
VGERIINSTELVSIVDQFRETILRSNTIGAKKDDAEKQFNEIVVDIFAITQQIQNVAGALMRSTDELLEKQQSLSR